jgi:hypothetical protein
MAMGKENREWQFWTVKRACVIVALVVMGAWVALKVHLREPHYRGKSLSEWVTGFDVVPFGLPLGGYSFLPFRVPSEVEENAKAVRAIGTNGIPFYLRMLGKRQGNLEGKIRRAGEKLHLVNPLPFAEADVQRKRAVLSFLALGSRAVPAIPALIQLLEGSDDEVSYSVAGVLANLGPAGKAAVPDLLRIVTDAHAKGTTRDLALSALWEIDPKAAAATGLERPPGLVL